MAVDPPGSTFLLLRKTLVRVLHEIIPNSQRINPITCIQLAWLSFSHHGYGYGYDIKHDVNVDVDADEQYHTGHGSNISSHGNGKHGQFYGHGHGRWCLQDQCE